jgi:hypothetical protein
MDCYESKLFMPSVSPCREKSQIYGTMQRLPMGGSCGGISTAPTLAYPGSNPPQAQEPLAQPPLVPVPARRRTTTDSVEEIETFLDGLMNEDIDQPLGLF